MRRDEIARRFDRDGFVFPLDIMPAAEAARHRGSLEGLLAAAAGEKLGNKRQVNYAHVIAPFAYEIVSHPKILDAVEAILGPDILVWGSTFFIKEPQTPSYVSWHQDLRYWGLDSDAEVSAWLALSEVDEENGCMRFLPGSHKGDLLPHRDSFDDKNFLTRGQEAEVEIAAEDRLPVILAPGQLSLHHGRLLHSSGPNNSARWRIGLVVNYIATSVRQTLAPRDFAMLVRGEDRYGHFELVPPPASPLAPEALAWHHRILAAQNEALYEGAAAGA